MNLQDWTGKQKLGRHYRPAAVAKTEADSKTEVNVEVKIGVAEAPREVVVMSNESPEAVEAKVADALAKDNGSLVLVDDKGRKVVVPAARIAYVEIGPSDQRKVGFNVGG